MYRRKGDNRKGAEEDIGSTPVMTPYGRVAENSNTSYNDEKKTLWQQARISMRNDE
jgi:hypothetical protein